MEDNLKLWDSVKETDPKYTKKANVKGNQITSISPQYQILNATRLFGVYGQAWGFKSLEFDYTLMDKGLVVLHALFYYPKGQFPILNSVQLYKDNAMIKIDDDFAKKVETDTLTKALSKLGFNADIFMGLYDDTKYFEDLKEKYKEPVKLPPINDELFGKYLDAIGGGAKDKKGELITFEYLLSRHTLTDAQMIEITSPVNTKRPRSGV